MQGTGSTTNLPIHTSAIENATAASYENTTEIQTSAFATELNTSVSVS